MSDKLHINAVGYVRCSTDMQDGSVVQQKAELSAWASSHNTDIIDWYVDEGKSGTSFDKRPSFRALLKEVESGNAKFEMVLVYDESRWGRPKNPRENNYWKEHFRRYGVTVRIIHSSSKNEDDVGSYVMEVVEGAEASEYSKKLGRATLRGMVSNARDGYSCGGSALYGYKRVAYEKKSGAKTRDLSPGDRSHDEERVKLDLGSPDEIIIVQKIFSLKVQGLGYRAIANTLNKDDVPCARRGRWKNKDQKWSSGTIQTIVTNPTYTGARVFNRHPQSHLAGPEKKLWFNDQKHWIVTENAHPAIVTKEVFESANMNRKKYARTNRHYINSPYLLSGLIRCAKCGFNYQGQTHTIRKNGRVMKVRYYEDGGYIGKGTSVCRSYRVNQERLDGYVIDRIARVIKQKGFLKKLEATIEKTLQDGRVQSSQVKLLQDKLEHNQKSVRKLLDIINKGNTLTEVFAELQLHERERKSIEQTITGLQSNRVKDEEIRVLVKQVRTLVESFATTFKKSPLHIQKNFIRRFVEKVTVSPDHQTVTCHFLVVPRVENPLMGRIEGTILPETKTFNVSKKYQSIHKEDVNHVRIIDTGKRRTGEESAQPPKKRWQHL